MYALTEIKGVGRRYANLVCKKADVDMNKRLVSVPISHQDATGNQRLTIMAVYFLPFE
jgi:ribosomal protein S13